MIVTIGDDARAGVHASVGVEGNAEVMVTFFYGRTRPRVVGALQFANVKEMIGLTDALMVTLDKLLPGWQEQRVRL